MRYVSDDQPGLSRQRKGEEFEYFDTKGKPIRDEQRLLRIKRLAIPPAWTEVWICPSSNGHIQATGRARLGFGPTRDVVIIDAELGGIAGVDDPTMAEVGRAFADQADWDPRGSPGYVFVLLRPRQIQAWRDANELSGKLLMQDGRWLFEV